MARFTTPDVHDEGPDRTLRAQPLSSESLAEMKAGVVMAVAVVAILLAGRLGLLLLDPQLFAALCVGGLAVGNVLALAWSISRRP